MRIPALFFCPCDLVADIIYTYLELSNCGTSRQHGRILAYLNINLDGQIRIVWFCPRPDTPGRYLLMKVTGRDEVSKYANQRALAPTKETPEETRKRSEVVRESHEDAVCSFSQRSRDVQKAHEAIQSEPDVRMGRVRAIRAKIEKGTYEIDFDKTAEKMLKAFTDEIS